MASTNTIVVAGTTSIVNLNATGKTDVEVGLIFEWLIWEKLAEMPEGLALAQQRQWKLDRAHRVMLDLAKAQARRNRIRILQEASVSLEQQAELETAL